MEPRVFVQVLEPLGSVWLAAAVALLPLGVLLVCLAGLRISAWLAVLLCAAVTVALAVVVWDAPLDILAQQIVFGLMLILAVAVTIDRSKIPIVK